MKRNVLPAYRDLESGDLCAHYSARVPDWLMHPSTQLLVVAIGTELTTSQVGLTKF